MDNLKRPPSVAKGRPSPVKKKLSVTPNHSSRRNEVYADGSESLGESDSPDDQEEYSSTDDDMMKHAKLASRQNESDDSEEEEYAYSSKHSHRR